MNKLKWVDALRGYAVLGVVIVHSVAGHYGIIGQKFLSLGAKGVQLFYMASAFTLMLSFHSRKSENYKTIHFYIRRFFRIAPMFWIAIIYYLWQNSNEIYDLSDYRYVSNWSIFSHFFFIHGVSPFWQDSVVPGGWSVGVEFLFYFSCPIIFRYVNNKQKAITFYIFSLFISTTSSILLLMNPMIPYQSTWTGYIYGFFPSQLHIFSIGVLLYFLTYETWKTSWKTLIFLLISILLISALTTFVIKYQSGQEANFFITFIFLLFILYIEKTNIKSFSNNIMVFLGKLSYSVYLIHFAVIYWLQYYNLDNLHTNPTVSYLIRFFMIMIISMLISFMTYKFIEQPFQKIGSSLIKKSIK